jgi:PII-like signaling protein
MKVTVARIYVTEGEHIHEKIFRRLHDEHKLRGVTLFRGISGFGRSGEMHASSLLDLSFDMPVVIEFFDEAGRVEAALASVAEWVRPGHVIIFDAQNS